MIDLLDAQVIQCQQHLEQQMQLEIDSQVSRDELLKISVRDLHLDHDNIEVLITEISAIVPEEECQLLDNMLELRYLLTDPDLLHADVTFLSFDKLDCEEAQVSFRKTLLDYSECTFAKLSASAEVELHLELRLSLEAVESSADVSKLQSRLWNINQHIAAKLLEELVLNLTNFATELRSSAGADCVLADKYQHLQQDDSECEDIDSREIDVKYLALALDQRLQLWRHVVVDKLTFDQVQQLMLSADSTCE